MLTKLIARALYWDLLQLSVKKRSGPHSSRRPHNPSSLVELREGEQGILDRLDLPEDVSRRLMELGFLPGSPIVAALSAPGGDPRVFRVDGAEIALRRDTAARVILRDQPPSGSSVEHEL